MSDVWNLGDETEHLLTMIATAHADYFVGNEQFWSELAIMSALREATALERKKAQKEIAAMRQQLEEAQKDAARYRYVRLGQWRILVEWNRYEQQYDALVPLMADAAIDAALEKGNEKQGYSDLEQDSDA